MNTIRLLLFALLLAVFSAMAEAQAPSRITPALLPLPLPSAVPMPPDRLRAENPWNLPMTGLWRFKLTHGRIVDGHFAASLADALGVSASSHEAANPPENAFDGLPDTRWCADSDTFPQWLQADLGQSRHVTGVTLVWERDTDQYQCRIEGSTDNKRWTTLANAPGTGLGNGPVTVTPTDARYVRIMVLGNSGKSWASLREFAIHYTDNGQNVAWRPKAPASAAPAHADDFTQSAFDDKGWDNLAVPSNWEMAGYSLPTYNAVDDTVGLYRRWVEIPKTWAGKRIFWRFDGALDGAEIFVNGHKAGYHESGYTAFDVDLSGLVIPGRRNLFAVRVSKTTPSSDCETGDFQCMGGIYRETSLIAVPPTHIADITVRTPLAANYQDATLTAQVQVAGTPGGVFDVTGTLVRTNGLTIPVHLTGQAHIGKDGMGAALLSTPVKAPKLWSAEKPSLYYLVLQLSRSGTPIEQVEQRFGFHQVEIKNDIVLWNGRPIKCTGTCRHDEWASKGWALTDSEWNKDLSLMKAANINAIRTSHYNHAARFLELCEEKGFYILDEVPFCWVGDQVKDPKFAPALLLRAADTVGRDKNRPCVLAWSIGNENPIGPDTQQVRDLIQRLDPTRPAFASQAGPWDLKGQDFRDMHYPSPDDVDHYVAADSDKAPAVFSEHPHIFYQKETQDYDPGASDLWSEALSKTWDKLWGDPTILGSFIWEWQNQGIADKYPDKTHDFWYGPDHLRQENNKGIVDAYRNPKPEWWIVKMVYSPVVIGARTVTPHGGVCTVPLTNHYSFTNLSETTCRWTALKGNATLKTALVHLPCAPMLSTTAMFPAPTGMTALRLAFTRTDGSNITSAVLAVTGSPTPTPPPAPPGGDALTTQDTADVLTVKNTLQQIAFDKHTGVIHSWRVRGRDLLLPGGPVLNLGEAKAGNNEHYYHAAQPPVTDGASVTSFKAPDGAVHVSVTSLVFSKTGGDVLGSLTTLYTIQPDTTIGVRWSLTWMGTNTRLWEAGLKFPTPPALSQMHWWRDSFFTDYPAGHLGEPTGVCRAGDTLFRASKRSLHWLTLTNKSGIGLALLASDLPLVGRADTGSAANTLFASREVAGPQDFSGVWVSDHDITASAAKPLSGAFTLRATGP